MPEVALDEAWVVVHDVLAEPDIHRGLAVVASEVVDSVLFGPDVHHLAGGYGEGVGEGCSHEG